MPFQPFLGQIMAIGFPFAPRGWALCDGQLLSITSNTALFSLLGTNYGGDGRTTFGLPNLQGRVAIGAGQSPVPGSSGYALGQTGGNSAVTLTLAQSPAHSHTPLGGSGRQGSTTSPLNAVWATPATEKPYATAVDGTMSNMAILPVGGNQPHDNTQPYLVIAYAIALVGIFPNRN